MKFNRIIILFAVLALCSCSKLPMKDFIGVWTVSQVEAHDITSDNDRIISTQAASPCFFVGEQMEFQKTKVIPCPTAIENIGKYEDFSGTFEYIFDSKSSSITFPEVNCFSSFTDPSTGYSSASSYTIYEIKYKVNRQDNNTLYLSGERFEYDNLGNAERCYRADIILTR